MRYAIIVQARMNSKRLYGKVLKKVNKTSPLQLILDKINYFGLKNKLIIATTNLKSDLAIIDFCKINKIKYFRGSSENVLERYYACSKKFNAKNIIRITADCPLVDMFLLKKMINNFFLKKLDYYSNTYPLPCKYPDGSDIEIFKFTTLLKAYKKAQLPSEKEHVTNLMYQDKSNFIKKKNMKNDFSKFRYTIDNKSDFKVFTKILNDHLYSDIIKFKVIDIVNFLKKNKKLISYQSKIKRNYGWYSSLKKDKRYLKN